MYLEDRTVRSFETIYTAYIH